jgi:hypothetical protein
MKKTFFTIYILVLLLSQATLSFSQDFYDMTNVQDIQVHLSQSNWDQLMDNAYATTGDYIMADSVTINGVVFDSVGVKFKGNSTYQSNQVKNPWHIELDTYKEQDYQGYKDIKLANAAKDPSFLRDVLGYQIVRQYMDAPEANFANLYVNGTLIGLYSNTEAITKTFLKDRFGSKNNDFVKCNPPAGAGPQTSDFPNLVYLGQSSTSYDDAYEIKSDNGWQGLINLSDTLKNNIADIEQILDVDRALWMLAFDNVIVNLDSYIGLFAQNYYLYRDDFDRFLSIVWDLNESFGTFSNTGSGNLNGTTAKRQMTHLLHSNDASYPLVSQLLSVPTYKKMYLAHVKTILTENFTNNGPYYTMALSLKATIDASVQADPNKFYTYAQFNSNLTTDITSGGGPGGGSSTPGITSLMNGRYTYLMAQSDFTATQPSISNILLSSAAPAIGSTITVTATVTDEQNAYLRYRSEDGAPFQKVEMFDDGNHNDGAANDNVFGADITISSTTTDYYIYAENNTIGKFSPVRAQHEFYTITATGGITAGDIVINEFMASNDTTVVDQDGEYDDWVELYNNSGSAIDISGYQLSDDNTDLGLFTFPSGTMLQPDSYIVVWADKDDTQSGYHADFKISSGGETIYLTDASQTIIDSVAFGTQTTDVAFGRFPNGTGAFQTLAPTFGAENGTITSIAKVENSDLDISIYPNPARDFFTIKIGNNDYQDNTVLVFNAVGMVVHQSTFQELVTINTNEWAGGMYFVRIGSQTKKLMIIR